MYDIKVVIWKAESHACIILHELEIVGNVFELDREQVGAL